LTILFSLFLHLLFAQPRLHPYAGLHMSGDAEMYYIGPSLQLGADYQLKKRSLVTAYLHYFHKYINNSTSIYTEHGLFKTITFAIMLQGNFSKKCNKSFFGAAGLAVQNWADRYEDSWESWNKKRTTVLPAARLGYFFTVNHCKLAIELNATGPYHYHEDSDDILEILTQLSVGMRIIL
jgi:hypothetical protein